MPHRFDVLGIGNAIVDLLAHTEEDFLVDNRLAKGTMRLVDAGESARLYGAMGPAVQASGGSAGNTIAGVASLGGKAAFIGKVAEDDLGQAYRHDLAAQGVHFATEPLDGDESTGRCMILVTPDGERTMNTFLGASLRLAPKDIDPAVVQDAAITYLEGYLWDPPPAKEAFLEAARIARKAGRRVALTLSDPFCVDRYRDEFRRLVVEREVDILFANVRELHALYQTADLDTAIAALRAECPLAAVTASADGGYVVTPERIERVAARPVERVVDATGAGDLFAAGFLFGLARGWAPKRSAELGALAAAEIISHMGPRPETSLAELARQAGF
jgi:adenosine kinase